MPTAGGTPSRTRSERRWQEDRWQNVVAPVGRFSGAMGLVLLLSLAAHVLIVGSALVSSHPDAVAPQQETPVEIVQEAPKEEVPKAEAAKPAAAAAPVKSAAADPSSELRKGEPERPEAKPEPQAAAVQPPPARSSPAQTAARQPPEPPKPVKADDKPDQKLAALKSELEELKAQREALVAERAESQAAESQAAEAQAAQSQAAQSQAAQSFGETAARIGLGPLPDSFQAVALPMSGDGADEAVSYQQIVFSQLAKAKGIGGRQGQPGSAGVRFAIDGAGHLTFVEVVAASGIPSLDAEALAIVRRAAPFPPPPPGARRAFVANVNFTPLPASLPSR